MAISQEISQTLPKPLVNLSQEDINKLHTVGQVVLTVLSVVGVVSLAAIAPNAVRILNLVPWRGNTYSSGLRKKQEQKEKIIKSFYYLKRQGYINLKQIGQKTQAQITFKGQKHMENLEFAGMQIPKMQKWDGHWWFVFADIPTKEFRSSADMFRKKLRMMNFYPLQRTVWVHPFNPRTQVMFAAAWYEIDRFVSLVEAVNIDEDDEDRLKIYFKNIIN